MCAVLLVVHNILTSFRRKLDYEDYESDDDEAEEVEEQDSDNESFHEAPEVLTLEERGRSSPPLECLVASTVSFTLGSNIVHRGRVSLLKCVNCME